MGRAPLRILGPVDPAVPVAVGLADPTQHALVRSWRAGYLGDTHKPFKPNGEMMEDLKLNLEVERFKNRKDLLNGFANLNRTIDQAVNVDTFTEEAFGVLTSSALVDALDLSKEDPKIREMYGDGKPFKFQYDGAPTVNEHVLMARRLVSAGARSVTLSYGRWDSHGLTLTSLEITEKTRPVVSALVEILTKEVCR